MLDYSRDRWKRERKLVHRGRDRHTLAFGELGGGYELEFFLELGNESREVLG